MSPQPPLARRSVEDAKAAAPSPSPRSRGALFIGAAFVFLVVACARPSPNLPTIESLGEVAPEVASAAREALDTLAADPRDAARWGRFGMICEANGVIEQARKA